MKDYAGPGSLLKLSELARQEIAQNSAALATKQDAFSTDDTLNMSHNSGAAGGVLGVSHPIKPVTQAEYDALSEAEKNSDTFWAVTDGDESGGSSAGEVYSTEETRIGTWIDGKPLYRKTYVATIPSVSDTDMEIATDTDDKMVYAMYGVWFYNARQAVPINSMSAHGWGSQVWWKRGALMMNMGTSITEDNLVGQNAYITIEYTKTTD